MHCQSDPKTHKYTAEIKCQVSDSKKLEWTITRNRYIEDVNIHAHRSPLAVVTTHQCSLTEAQATRMTTANSIATPRLTAIMLGDAFRKPFQPRETKPAEMVRQSRHSPGVFGRATYNFDNIRRFTRVIDKVICFIKKPRTEPVDDLELGCPYHPGITIFANGNITGLVRLTH